MALKASLAAGAGHGAHVPADRHRARLGARQHDRRARVGPLPAPPARRLRSSAVSRDERGLGRLHRAAHDRARGRQPQRHVRAWRTYSTSAFDPNSAYFGIRRVPYSVDFTKNALTFKHITDGDALPAVPTLPRRPQLRGAQRRRDLGDDAVGGLRRAAEGARARRDSFDDVRRRMADYVVAGLKMTPRDATYTEQRDAILAAAAAATRRDDDDDHGNHGQRQRSERTPTGQRRPADARHGVRSPRRRHLRRLAAARFDRTSPGSSRASRSGRALSSARCGSRRTSSCDHDGFVDAGERGAIVVPVMNGGPVEMLNTIVSITTSRRAVTSRSTESDRISRIAPFGSRRGRGRDRARPEPSPASASWS